MKAAITNVKKYLQKHNKTLPKKASTPFWGDHRPETDTTEDLNIVDAAYNQSLIGVLQWIVERVHVDITCNVSEMASMITMPRTGRLDEVYDVFRYPKIKHISEMVFDSTEPN